MKAKNNLRKVNQIKIINELSRINKLDLHNHTRVSYDSTLSTKLLMRCAYKKGIKFVAITDHESVKNIERAKYFAKPNQFVIPGFEIKTNYGDIIGLFLDEIPRSFNFHDVIDFIEDNAGISIIPHPYRHTIKLPDEYVKAYNRVDMIEIFNGRTDIVKNMKALELARTLNKFYSAGSDAHTYLDIGISYLTTNQHLVTENDIRKYLLSRGKTGKYRENMLLSNLYTDFIKYTNKKQYHRYPVIIHKMLIKIKNELF
jgi:hypothetical protein